MITSKLTPTSTIDISNIEKTKNIKMEDPVKFSWTRAIPILSKKGQKQATNSIQESIGINK